MQTNLTQQISQADTAIAELESQVSYVTGLFAQYTGAINTAKQWPHYSLMFVDVVACLRESARRGDWKTAVRTGREPAATDAAGRPRGTGRISQLLKEALIAAKASRAHVLPASLVAARTRPRASTMRSRHAEFGEPADF